MNDMEKIALLNTPVQTSAWSDIKKRWIDFNTRCPSFGQVLQMLNNDKYIRQLYSCDNLDEKQKKAIREHFDQMHGVPVYVNEQCMLLFKKLIDTNTSLKGFSVDYLSWLLKLSKVQSPLYKHPSMTYTNEKGLQPNMKYNCPANQSWKTTTDDTECLRYAVRELVHDLLSDAKTLATVRRDAEKEAYSYNDLGVYNTYDQWFDFFSTRPGWDKYVQDILSRPKTRTVQKHLAPDANGLYPFSSLYFA